MDFHLIVVILQASQHAHTFLILALFSRLVSVRYTVRILHDVCDVLSHHSPKTSTFHGVGCDQLVWYYYFYAKWTPGQNTCLIMLCAAMFLWLLITTVIESFSCPTRRVAPTKNFKQKIPAYQPMCIHVSASIWKWVYRILARP